MATITRTPGDVQRGRRPDVEDELTKRYHVSWQFITQVSTRQFNHEESRRNQARFQALDPETVNQYAEGVKRGDAFPAVIAYRGRGGKYVIVDGNHRLAAHDKVGAPIDVYEVDPETDPRAIALMTYSFNTRHGKPTTEAERLVQAVYMVQNGATVPNAAAALNIPQGKLQKALAKEEADRRADEVGLKRNEWDSLNVSVKNRLKSITTDEGFKAAAELSFAAKLAIDEVGELIQLVNSTRAAGKQEQIVAAQREMYMDRIQTSGGGVLTAGSDRRRQSPKQRLALAAGQVLSLPDDTTGILALYAPAERDATAARLRDAATRLAEIADVLVGKKGG